jgi:hypothetical protein
MRDRRESEYTRTEQEGPSRLWARLKKAKKAARVQRGTLHS